MKEKMNFIVIMIDDMGWKDIGCAGSQFYETPNIDRLSREGMIFPNAYASCPVCSPSRASYLTGQYPAATGITDWIDMGNYHPIRRDLIEAPYEKHLPAGKVTIAEMLRREGYATWHIGKWHLGGEDFYPEKFGFEKNIGGCSWGRPCCGYFSPYQIHTLSEGPDGEYLTDRLTDEAVKLILSDEKRPFFMNLCHYTVHAPLEAKEKDIERFRKKAEELGLDRQESLIEGEPIPSHPETNVVRRVIQSDPVYAAMIWNLDENVGRLMDALYESGKADNTFVIFTSDNGGLSTSEGSSTCNFPAREGKGWMYEGGTRVPLLMWCPSLIEPYGCCCVSVDTPDLYPTIMDIAGAADKIPESVDGVSLAPLLRGEDIEPRALFWHYPHYGNQGGIPGSSAVMGDFKYIEFYQASGDEVEIRSELYNIKVDLCEHYNIIDKFPEKAKELQNLLHDWQRRNKVKFPSVNPDYMKSGS